MEEIMGSGIGQKQTDLALAADGHANVCHGTRKSSDARIPSPFYRLSTASVLTAISGSTFRQSALMDCPISRDASGAQFAAA
jgi:hypothetical protein